MQELKRAGYSLEELRGRQEVEGQSSLSSALFTARELRGVATLHQLRSEGGFSIAELHHAGFAGDQLRVQAGATPWELAVECGFTKRDLIRAGFTYGDLRRHSLHRPTSSEPSFDHQQQRHWRRWQAGSDRNANDAALAAGTTGDHQQAIGDGEEEEEEEGESAIEAVSVGSRVEMWWDGDRRFYTGTVRGFNPQAGTHTIAYDDGDIREYALEEKGFLLLPTNLQLQPPMRH